MDVGQFGDPGATPSSGGPHAALRMPMFSGGPLMVGPSACLFPVGVASGEVSGESRAIMSPTRVHLEQNQSVGKIMVDDPAVLPQVSTVDEDLLHAVVDVRDRVSWPLGSCSESASGGSYVWWGNYAVDLVVSWLIGLGLPLNHFQHSQSLQSRVEAGNFKSQPFGC